MPNPSSSNPQYFEAIIQLRPKNKELFDYVYKQILSRKDVFISKLIEENHGIDLYISSQRYARALGNKLKKVFKGKLVTSRKLFGPKQGKMRYRVTVLFRLD